MSGFNILMFCLDNLKMVLMGAPSINNTIYDAKERNILQYPCSAIVVVAT